MTVREFAAVARALGPRELVCDCGRTFTPENDHPERDQCMNCRAAGGPSYRLTTAGEIFRHAGPRYQEAGRYIVKWEYLITGSVQAVAGEVTEDDRWRSLGWARIERSVDAAIAMAVADADQKAAARKAG